MSYLNILTTCVYTYCFVCQSHPVYSQYCGWSSPCGFYYDCKTPFNNNHQETEAKKKGLLLISPRNYMAHLGPHSKVARRKRALWPGILLLLGSRVEA